MNDFFEKFTDNRDFHSKFNNGVEIKIHQDEKEEEKTINKFFIVEDSHVDTSIRFFELTSFQKKKK